MFSPHNDTRSILTALTFQRVLRQILDMNSTDSVGEQEILWGTHESTSAPAGVVFASDSMFAVIRMVKQISPTDVSGVITGETGTGKEVIARAIHDHSRRASMPFLALNCAAVPKDLLESQLFGHRKGAFSGATENHLGIVRAANGGTFFLDEIGELPIDMQAKMLRFLEMSEVHPIGDNHPVKVNVRLVFATNGDLEAAVSQNRFRQDLFYRLNVIPIKVPPLRERREEIPVLANLFAQRCAAELAKSRYDFHRRRWNCLFCIRGPETSGSLPMKSGASQPWRTQVPALHRINCRPNCRRRRSGCAPTQPIAGPRCSCDSTNLSSKPHLISNRR